MAKIDMKYHQLLEGILERGYLYETENRPDVVMRQISSVNLEIELMEEFPAVTTKKLYWKAVVAELIWFLRGDDSIKFLIDNDVHIWNKDAYNYHMNGGAEEGFSIQQFIEGVRNGQISGTVGRNYGVQWRDWRQEVAVNGVLDTQDSDDYISQYIDQIDMLITNLRKPNPISRRHIVTAWNPAELDQTALPPCHWAFEVLPRPLGYSQKIQLSGGDKTYLETLWKAGIAGKDEEAKKTLDRELEGIPDYGFTLKWHQRSVDTFLGLPFNIASYGILAHLIGVLTDMMPLSLIGDLSNVHIYGPHTDAVKKQLKNSVLAYPGTQIKFSDRLLQDVNTYKEKGMNLNEFFNRLEITDFELRNYKSFGTIPADMIAPATGKS